MPLPRSVGPGGAVGHGVVGGEHAEPAGALHPDRVLGDQQLVLVDECREGAHHLVDQRVELVGHVGEQPADADEGGVHAHPAHQLVDVEQLLALAPRVDERRGGAEVERAGAVPEEVAGHPGELAHDHAQVLRARRHLDAEEALGGQREPEVVEQRRQVVHPVGERDALLPGVRLERLLEAGVQEADVGAALAHHLAVELEHQAQHAVRAGVLRAHVQLHGLVVELHHVDGVVAGVDAEHVRDRGRTRRSARRGSAGAVPPGGGRTAISACPPACRAGRSAAGSAHSRLCVKATGSPKLT